MILTMNLLLNSSRRPEIIKLSTDVVNQIAAGEVVERPAAAIKELVENAIDAGAISISVSVTGGGLKRIQVEDDGCGMTADDLKMALERHATSKLKPDSRGKINLQNIDSMGFRGEALPSIASVSRLTITSAPDKTNTSKIIVNAGKIDGPKPAAWTGRKTSGTIVEVCDLFFATPARLKFMKKEQSETNAVADIMRRLAMANPTVAMSLESNGRTLCKFLAEADDNEGRLKRLGEIMGKEFYDNSVVVNAERSGVTIFGFAGLPTLNRGNSSKQFLFVNGRPVKDRMLNAVVRAAYQDFLARDRHPLVALFIEIEPELVDVNVHPAKTEVRFRDPRNVSGLMVTGLRKALAEAGHRASTTVADETLGKIKTQVIPEPTPNNLWSNPNPPNNTQLQGDYNKKSDYQPSPEAPKEISRDSAPTGQVIPEPTVENNSEQDEFPLGVARAQLHETYVVAQTKDGIVIVDQHAAHERLVYEKMKHQMAEGDVKRQALLIPEIVELTEDEVTRVVERALELKELGLEIEPFGAGAICVRATPALFGEMDAKGLVRDLADDFSEYDAGLALTEKFEEVMGNMACRGSVRAGRRLNGEEMNALLRQMEATPYSGQCNHGRPTYVELKLSDIETLFGRR